MRRTRVIHVTLQLKTGGMEMLLAEFARHVDRRRFEQHFVAIREGGAVASQIEAMGCPITVLNEPEGARIGLISTLAHLFRQRRADVVHAHNTKPLLYSAPASWLAGVSKMIYTRHGQRSKASWRQNQCFKVAAKLADAVVCVSQDGMLRSIAEGVSRDRVRTIWNGIDTTRFSYNGPTNAGPAVMVGRLSPEKDVATLLRATAIIVAQEPAFELEIAGDGACRQSLERMVNDLGIRQHVRFLGMIEDIPGVLSRSSMTVLSSLTEGISLTLLEAMARGLPTVATDVGGNPEVVVNGITGLLVPAGNPERLAEAMLRIWRNPEMGRRMGETGCQRVVEHFDIRRMIEHYEQLYSSRSNQRQIRRGGAPASIAGHGLGSAESAADIAAKESRR